VTHTAPPELRSVGVGDLWKQHLLERPGICVEAIDGRRFFWPDGSDRTVRVDRWPGSETAGQRTANATAVLIGRTLVQVRPTDTGAPVLVEVTAVPDAAPPDPWPDVAAGPTVTATRHGDTVRVAHADSCGTVTCFCYEHPAPDVPGPIAPDGTETIEIGMPVSGLVLAEDWLVVCCRDEVSAHRRFVAPRPSPTTEAERAERET
jgi:hypothetical protein